MTAIEHFHDGRLADAINAQLQEVRTNPTDPGRRVFLAELLAFSGDLDRARRQIETIPLGEPRVDRAVRDVRNLLDSETARRLTFSTGQQPQFFGDAPEHLMLRLEALKLIREGALEQATELLVRAEEMTPTLPGTLDGRAFTRLRDTDDVLAGVLEVLALGKYYWVPLESVVSLSMNPPRFPRDLLFIAARLELAEESGEIHLPALYPGASAESDILLQLGRLTEWRSTGEGGPTAGVGAKVYQIDDDDVALIDWRQLSRAEAATSTMAPDSEGAA
jgi:type VI secretion system protein ImpE